MNKLYPDAKAALEDIAQHGQMIAVGGLAFAAFRRHLSLPFEISVFAN